MINALSELKKVRNKNKLIKKDLGELKEMYGSNPKEIKNIFIDLKIQLEEAKIIEETFRRTLEEKEKIQEELEEEIISLRKESQKKDI